MRSKPYVQNTPPFIPGEKASIACRTGEDGRVMSAIPLYIPYEANQRND